MSVLACDRYRCENTMCDTLVDEKYICDDCADEFRNYVGDQPINRNDMFDKFRLFMETPKVTNRGYDLIDVDTFLTK